MGPITTCEALMPIPPAIQEVVEAFARAQLAGNPSAAAALFAEDAVMYPPVSQAVVRGRPAIDELLRAVHSRLR
ncbi:MAG TPA: SgcJ/EcaC family oxidoreductase, partial [Polyangia bacterium]